MQPAVFSRLYKTQNIHGYLHPWEKFAFSRYLFSQWINHLKKTKLPNVTLCGKGSHMLPEKGLPWSSWVGVHWPHTGRWGVGDLVPTGRCGGVPSHCSLPYHPGLRGSGAGPCLTPENGRQPFAEPSLAMGFLWARSSTASWVPVSGWWKHRQEPRPSGCGWGLLVFLHMCLKVFGRSLIKTPTLKYFSPKVTLIEYSLSQGKSLVSTAAAAAGRPWFQFWGWCVMKGREWERGRWEASEEGRGEDARQAVLVWIWV